LEPVFPGLSQHWNGKATVSLPALNPNFNLSYGYYRVSQYHTIGGYAGLRQGNIFFGGEHCSEEFQGYMEGGAAEGVRAAQEILAEVGPSAPPVGFRERGLR